MFNYVIRRAGMLLIMLSLLLGVSVMSWADSGRGLNRKLYALPVPGKVVINGNLDDWDWSGYIESYDREEVRASQRAEFAVMYDAEALYLAAKVKDVSPLMNRHNPAADADKAWMGDCCQFRLVSDRRMPFPFLRGSLGADDAKGAEVGQPLHLMLWYFTDKKEPALQIHKSFAMQAVREGWGPHGVVPHENFQAAYLADADGKGYSFEYRIPWDTLNAGENYPISGDVITATAQFLWGDAAGMVNTASAYDVMSKPGFPFQESSCWGKLIFSAKGDIPRSWVDPYLKPVAPKPLTFSYMLPADGEVSLALYDKDNRIVRHIVAQAARKAGEVTEQWDGNDSSGKPLPPGDYTWKGLYHQPLQTRYVMSIGNSGQPAWKTADGTGGWGGDYGPPTAATAVGDRMILGWTSHEAGWGIICTDLTGKKQWGISHKNASLLANDGTRFFANGEGEGREVNVYSVASGQPLVFGNGRQGLQAPDGGGAKTNAPSGIAWADGVLYVSFHDRNLISAYDAKSGDMQQSWQLPNPGRLAVGSDGALLAISGEKVMRRVKDKFVPFDNKYIDVPAGLAVDAAGLVYIANQGKLQNVTVLSPEGKYQGSIGRKGGRPVVGAYDPRGMLQPAGIAIDELGQLWVPEATSSLKRISVWNSKNGKLINEFFGACSYSPFVWIDPQNPKEAFFDNTIWQIDLKKGNWYPKATYYNPKSANSVNNGGGGFFYPFRVFTARNGRQYAVAQTWAFGPVLWIREGDQFRPLHYLFRNHPNPVLCPRPPFPIMNDTQAYPPGKIYLWSDNNVDEEAQLDEIKEITGNPPFFNWMDADLNLYGDGVVYRPTLISKKGVPEYDFANPERISPLSTGTTWVDATGKSIWGWHDGGDLSRYNVDGTRAWLYPNLRTWHDTINVGSPEPGTLWGATCPIGVVGRYSGLVSYFGTVDIVRDDGLFISQVFEHPAKGNNGPNIFYVEFLAGQMVQPKGSKQIYILAGDQDCRVSELTGLDSVKDLPGGVYHHTAELAAQAENAWQDYQSKISSSQPLVLARGGVAGLDAADPVGKSVDEKHAFQVKAAYDADGLYLQYNVTSPAPLLNAMVDPQMIFKGGNLIDIQLGVNQNVDEKRTRPVVGDERLLISLRNGKPWAVLMRPKVAGFTGEIIHLTSPTGFEDFDAIRAVEGIVLRDYHKTTDGFTVTVMIPREILGLPTLQAGSTLRMDVGYIFGNAGGTGAAMRAYWHNNSFSANVVNDIPHESRLEPAEWGTARVE